MLDFIVIVILILPLVATSRQTITFKIQIFSTADNLVRKNLKVQKLRALNIRIPSYK